MSVKPIGNTPPPLSNMGPKDQGSRPGRNQIDIIDNKDSSVEAGRADLKIPLEEAVERLNGLKEFHDRGIRFSVDEETEKVVIKIVDSGTNEVIRQIPPEEVLNMIRHLNEFQGLLINKRG